jgi:DNA-binding NarL/FixJ family response regulator
MPPFSILWKKLFPKRTGPRLVRQVYRLDEDVLMELRERARRDGRPAGDLAAELIANGLEQRDIAESYQGRWLSLTRREQQVAALMAQDLTYRQIGYRLNISEQTVRVHVRGISSKFGLHSRLEIQRVLEKWDFSDWKL